MNSAGCRAQPLFEESLDFGRAAGLEARFRYTSNALVEPRGGDWMQITPAEAGLPATVVWRCRAPQGQRFARFEASAGLGDACGAGMPVARFESSTDGRDWSGLADEALSSSLQDSTMILSGAAVLPEPAPEVFLRLVSVAKILSLGFRGYAEAPASRSKLSAQEQ